MEIDLSYKYMNKIKYLSKIKIEIRKITNINDEYMKIFTHIIKFD